MGAVIGVLVGYALGSTGGTGRRGPSSKRPGRPSSSSEEVQDLVGWRRLACS